MNKYSANEVRRNDIILYKSKLYKIVSIMHTKPGKGPAYVQTEMICLTTGKKYQDRLSGKDKLEKISSEEVVYNYQYTCQQNHNFLNLDSGEMLEIDKNHPALSEDLSKCLKENTNIDVRIFTCKHDNTEKIVDIKIENEIVAEIVDTEPYLKNATATSSPKQAILNNGLKITVPQFLTNGTKIVLDQNLNYKCTYKATQKMEKK